MVEARRGVRARHAAEELLRLAGLLMLVTGSCDAAAVVTTPGSEPELPAPAGPPETAEPGLLPYDRSSPVIYVNDDVIDVYTDEYLMALTSAGAIQLRAIVTQSSVAPYNQWVTTEYLDNATLQRAEGVAGARASGMRNVPDPIRDFSGHLQEPAGGRIEDTRPLIGAATQLIVAEARKATPDLPLVVVMGGPLTVAVSAYLSDPTIADRMVVAWLGGSATYMGGYNAWADAWASYVALERLRLVIFPEGQHAPAVPKSRLTELPAMPLRAWMQAKQHPNGLPGEMDADAPPAIGLMLSKYAQQVKRVGFDRWIQSEGRALPQFRENPASRALVVTAADRDAATREWWRALKNPASYH